MKKFILIDHEPWTLRRKELFYDLFEKAGIPLVVWDLSNWLYPGLHDSDEICEVDYMTKVYSEEQFKYLLKSEDSNKVIIVEEVFRNWDNRKVYKNLYRLGFNTIKIELYGNTVLKQNFISKIRSLNIKDLPRLIRLKYQSYLYKIYSKLYRIKKPIKLFSSNGIRWRTDCINHPDFENNKLLSHRDNLKEEYIVFCDIYFPYHPDLVHFFKVKSLPNAEHYQKSLRSFFDYIESKYNLPIIVAAHPKADYKGGEFGNREIIKYQTALLIKNANKVILHHCNSVSYAVLNDKPMVFIGTEEYLNLQNTEMCLKLLATTTLGLPYYNIDKQSYSQIEFLKVSSEIREKYIHTYLTTPKTYHLTNPEIIAKSLKNI